jgi:hypothetical protein
MVRFKELTPSPCGEGTHLSENKSIDQRPRAEPLPKIYYTIIIVIRRRE